MFTWTALLLGEIESDGLVEESPAASTFGYLRIHMLNRSVERKKQAACARRVCFSLCC